MDVIYKNIRALCKERRVTVSALEKELGLGKATIQKWRTASPSVENLKKVADCFDVSVDFLLSDSEEPGTSGKITVISNGQAVCGLSFDSLRKLLDGVRLFANGDDIQITISKTERRCSGDGATG